MTEPTVPIPVDDLRELHALMDELRVVPGYKWAERLSHLLPPLPWEPDPAAIEALTDASAQPYADSTLRRLHVAGWHLVREEPSP